MKSFRPFIADTVGAQQDAPKRPVNVTTLRLSLWCDKQTPTVFLNEYRKLTGDRKQNRTSSVLSAVFAFIASTVGASSNITQGIFYV